MIKKTRRLTPRNYSGTLPTSHHVKEILPGIIAKISSHYQNRPDQVIAMWPQIIGPQLAKMTQAIGFYEGVLKVKVNNSTLLSLLTHHEKMRLLEGLKKQLPHVEITNIQFQIG